MPDKSEISNLFSKVCSCVFNNRLKEALISLGKMMEGLNVADYTLEFENLDNTYRMLLEYTFRGVPDPQRDRILMSLKTSILELADKVQQKSMEKTGLNTASLKKQIEKEKEFAKEDATRNIDTLSFDQELDRMLRETEVQSGGQPGKGISYQVTPKLFQVIWLTDKYTDTDIQLIDSIRLSKYLPWYEKCLAVSAISLSLMNCFDTEKFLQLFKFYEQRENEVWQRALTAIVIAVYFYDKRIELYPSIDQKIREISRNELFFSDITSVLIAFFKALETEKVTSEFKKEITPDIQKIEEKIREKLDIDHIIGDEIVEDKNPDWETLFEDTPGLLDKIEKMSNMQMDGVDLFMGTFAMLKHFDFFRDISNWFRPFYKENEVAREAVASEGQKGDAFLEGMENSFYMCNSDKYSFCLNMSHLPDNQRSGIMGMFNAEAESLKELKEEENLLANPSRENYIFTQYIQDLYRFYKLHPFRSDFRDIFAGNWQLEDTVLFELLKHNNQSVNRLAEFLFEKERYAEAIPLLSHLSMQPEPSGELIGKLAYSYQRTGDVEKALEYYRQCELFDVNRQWSVKKIIYCLRQLNRDEEALKWCLEALTLDPQDTYINTMAGNCLFDLKRYPEALEYYFKVEILSPGNTKLRRPIAWCSMAAGKPEIARNYYALIVQDNPTADDYINAGNVEYCLSAKPKAIDMYIKALRKPGMSIARFSKTLKADYQLFESQGVSSSELELLVDYLRYLV